MQIEWTDASDEPKLTPRWWSIWTYLNAIVILAQGKVQAKLDESRKIRNSLAKAEAAEASIRQALLGVEKLALDPRFTAYSQERIRIKLLELLAEVDE